MENEKKRQQNLNSFEARESNLENSIGKVASNAKNTVKRWWNKFTNTNN